MQWDDLRYVLALRRSGTLSAASRELGVNPTTVARRVAALEEQLGARLFDKTPQGFFPTTAGEDILRVAHRIEEELLSLDRHVIGWDTRLSGPLRVTRSTPAHSRPRPMPLSPPMPAERRSATRVLSTVSRFTIAVTTTQQPASSAARGVRLPSA